MCMGPSLNYKWIMHAFPVPAVLACATSAWLPYLVWQPAEAQLSPPPSPSQGRTIDQLGKAPKN